MTKVMVYTSTEKGIVAVEVDCIDGIAANSPLLSPFEDNTGALIGQLTEYLSDEKSLGKLPRYLNTVSEKVYKGGTVG